jgi:nicotinate-nucleotide adenylyltransferase
MSGRPTGTGGLIGAFGGTFNPIHLGHLRAAEEVCEALDLERLLFVPAADPPLKRGGAADPLAPAPMRVAWAREAVRDNPRFAVDDLELAREGPSYTVDTVRALRARVGAHRLVFVIGCDAFEELDAWREPEALLALCHFAVITRPPAGGESLADWLPRSLAGAVELEPDGQRGRHRAGTWIRRLEIRALDISATDVRRRVSEGRSVRYLLPEGVRRAVIESGIYGRRSDA